MKSRPSIFFSALALFTLAWSVAHASRLSEDFSVSSNPTHGWTFGSQSHPGGAFHIYPVSFFGEAFGNQLGYWGLRINDQPFVRKNLGPNDFAVTNQGLFPVGGMSVTPGATSAAGIGNYSTVRYTIPESGVYRISLGGYSSGSSDVDVHVVQDGYTLQSANLFTGQTSSYTNEQFYAEGTVIDIAVGSGEDHSNYGAVFQLDAEAIRLDSPDGEFPTIGLNPPRGAFEESLSVELIRSASVSGEIRYTLDGSVPGPESPLYSAPILLNKTTLIRAGLFDHGHQVGRSVASAYALADDLNDPAALLPFERGLSSQFSSAVNPTKGWILGYKTLWNGSLKRYSVHYSGRANQGLAQVNAWAYWGLNRNAESWIRQNVFEQPISDPLQGSFPVRGLSAAPGPDGKPDQYAVARYTIPSNGVYSVKVFGYASGIGQVDARITQDGVLVKGKVLKRPASIQWKETLYLFAGTTLDLGVGRVPSTPNYGSILQFDAQIEPATVTVGGTQEIAFNPPRGFFTNDFSLVLSNALASGVIRYTLDGTAPTVTSTAYLGPIPIASNTLVRATVFDSGHAISATYGSAFHRSEEREDGIPWSWFQHYFGEGYSAHPDTLEDSDADHDGSSNLKEYFAETDPTDPLSGFDVGIKTAPCLTFVSVPGRTYRILRRESADAAWVEVGRVAATGLESRFVDVTLEGDTSFYRVEVVR